MALAPLEVQKMRFRTAWRGFDREEVGNFLSLIAEELATRLSDQERLTLEAAQLRNRLAEGERREQELQTILVRAQKVADSVEDQARREARLVLDEAQATADRIVQQAIEQATHIESRISELALDRRELHARLRAALEIFSAQLDRDVEEDRNTATVHVFNRARRSRVE